MLALGDRMAQGLGVSLLKTRLFCMLAIALLCGAAVSIAELGGFIGLVVPQLIRRLVTVDIRAMVPLSACVGRWFSCWRMLPPALFTPYELATGVMTALVGARRLYLPGVEDVQMSRAGLRALRVISAWVRPKALACLAFLSLAAFLLLEVWSDWLAAIPARHRACAVLSRRWKQRRITS